MDIRNRTVLVLGGWGLVGSAICHKLMEERPKRMVVTSLLEREAVAAAHALQRDFPKAGKKFFVPWWGDIFVRHALKDKPRDELLRKESTRQMLIDDLLDDLSQEVLERSSIFHLLTKYKPDVVIDCINSATAIAYQDVFKGAREVRKQLKKGSHNEGFREEAERLLATLYVPQLIRHVQILYRSMQQVGTSIYVKIGTSGTGGMGLNIPYTHSEERPSSVLLSKSAVAGAHTMLLFLMGRTPDAPITKEVKPAAAIAWKRIGFGEITKRGKAIDLFDCQPEQGVALRDTLKLKMESGPWTPLRKPLRSVFIDTGENGIFSRGEFEAIATPGQMEFVTPEEIADNVIFEIRGGNTGHDIINALDNATLNPTYRAGYLYESAIQEMKALEKQHQTRSVAFEFLGPPRLSKLLYESSLLQREFGSMINVTKTPAAVIAQRLLEYLRSNTDVRAQIISIGIPILMPDGKTLLRAKEIKIPPYRGENELRITKQNIETWAHDGWLDLRTKNWEHWKWRFATIMKSAELIPLGDSSSRHMYNRHYWGNFEEIDAGKIVGWIFSEEDKGKRMKA